MQAEKAKRAGKSDALKVLMADGRWHHMRELNRITFRYGARFHEWRKAGVQVEKRSAGVDAFEYRLVVQGQQRLI